MNSVTPTPTPTLAITFTQTPTNNSNSSFIEEDFVVGIVMVVIGLLSFIALFILELNFFEYNKDTPEENTKLTNYAILSLIYCLAIVLSGVFLILASKNVNLIFYVPQNSVYKNDIVYGLIFIFFGTLLIVLLYVIYYLSREIPVINAFSTADGVLYIFAFALIATLYNYGIRYIISGEYT